MTRPQDAATEALAYAVAVLKKEDHRLTAFRRGIERYRADYDRIIEDADVFREALKSRGYVIRKARKSG